MNFSELKVNPLILMGIEKMGFEEMTDIQSKVIPVALDGVDIIGQAPTGTGKTISTLFPAIKTFPDGKNDKIFYLSAKNQTKEVALNAIKKMIEKNI